VNLQELAEQGRSIRAERLLRCKPHQLTAESLWRMLRTDAGSLIGDLIELVPLQPPLEFQRFTTDYRLALKPWKNVPILSHWAFSQAAMSWNCRAAAAGLFYIPTLWRVALNGHLPECYGGQTANTPAEAVAICVESEEHYARVAEQMDLLVSAGK
jgi:hypothetical protein